MSKPLRLLLVEDSDLDAAHIVMLLKRGGFAPDVRRVETREEMLDALRSQEWDIVVCDYTLPRFSAPEALDALKESGRDLPFIAVSGAVGEETAVELMRNGAADYLLKHRLTRLIAAIEREMAQARERKAKRRAEDLFRAVLRAAPQPSVVVDRLTKSIVDGSDAFRLRFMTGAVATIFDAVQFTHPERIEALVARGSGVILNAVYYHDGSTRVANVRCYSVEHEGQAYAYLVLDDVTEQNYLKAAFDAVPDPLLIISSQRTLLYANRPAESLFGQLYFGADVSSLVAGVPLARKGEVRIDFDGQPYEASTLPFRFAGETETSTILTLRNISQEEELLRLATHDALTGIYNIRYFDDALRKAIESGASGSVAIVDLDYFKPINDELGHAAGDAALITFANIIRPTLRPTDVFARLGGDEFAILFDGAALPAARQTLETIYERLTRSPFRFDGTARPFSASVGLAVLRADDSPESLKRRADEALYEAKKQGRGRWVVAE
jgi:diguanylate cyclase (GGDEF)-like protein